MAQNNGPRLNMPAVDAMLYGTLEWAGVFESARYPGKLELKVDGWWENGTTGRDAEFQKLDVGTRGAVWLPWKAAEVLASAGLIVQDANDRKRFTVTKGQRFFITRAEEKLEKGRVHNWTAGAIDAEGRPVRMGRGTTPKMPATKAETEAGPAEPAATPAPAPTSDAPVAAPAPGSDPPPPPPAQAEPSPNGKGARGRELLQEADAIYGASLGIAAFRLMCLYQCPITQIPDRTLQAGAATVLRYLESRGYTPTQAGTQTMIRRALDSSAERVQGHHEERAAKGAEPRPPSADPPMTQTTAEKAWADRPEALGPEEDDDLPF